MRTIDVVTAGGTSRTQLFTPPAGRGPWPVLIVCTDAGGQRAAFEQLAQGLAAEGFLVAVPDLFFRTGSPLALLPEPERTFTAFITHFRGTPGFREQVAAITRTATSPEAVSQLFSPLLDALAAQPDAKPGKVAVTGYCMGATVVLRAASSFADRVAAGATFHGGNLVTPEPTSPHLGVPRITAELRLAAAVEDASFPDEMETTLRQAFQSAGTRYHLERWPGAHHGFAVPDTLAFKPEFGARHHAELTDFCRRALG